MDHSSLWQFLFTLTNQYVMLCSRQLGTQTFPPLMTKSTKSESWSLTLIFPPRLHEEAVVYIGSCASETLGGWKLEISAWKLWPWLWLEQSVSKRVRCLYLWCHLQSTQKLWEWLLCLSSRMEEILRVFISRSELRTNCTVCDHVALFVMSLSNNKHRRMAYPFLLQFTKLWLANCFSRQWKQPSKALHPNRSETVAEKKVRQQLAKL